MPTLLSAAWDLALELMTWGTVLQPWSAAGPSPCGPQSWQVARFSAVSVRSCPSRKFSTPCLKSYLPKILPLFLLNHVQLAIVFETLGAFLLGRTITGTIQSGIADLNAYTREPQVGYGLEGFKGCLLGF